MKNKHFLFLLIGFLGLIFMLFPALSFCEEKSSHHFNNHEIETKSMENKNILISGAGISGLSLALLFEQYGFNPVIVEKHPRLRAEGYKIDIRGVAVNVIKNMGIYEDINANRTEIKEARFVDDSGRCIATTSPDFCGVRVNSDVEINRGQLCEILHDKLKSVEIIYNDSIKHLTQSEKQVEVEFASGKKRSFDLVIGADGLHSKVRKSAWSNGPDFLKKLGLYISFYSIPNYLNLDSVEIEYHSDYKFAIAYCPKNGVAKAGFAFSSDIADEDLRSIPAQKKALKEAFENSYWEIPQLLEYADNATDFYFDCIAQVRMPHWTKNRVAPCGDAGYAVSPISGQGASVALVGAYVLAGELALHQGNYEKAFAAYENELKEYIKKNQNLAEMNAKILDKNNQSWKSSLLLGLNKLLFRFMPGTCIKMFKEMGLQKTKKAANSISLKPYSLLIETT